MLGEEGSVLWAITATSSTSYELPGKSVIEAAAQRVIDLLTARIPRDKESNVEAYRRGVQAQSQLPAAAMELSRMILGPVAGQLQGQRLLIVADGNLHFIPFAMLPRPDAAAAPEDRASVTARNRRTPAGRNAAAGKLLIESHEIVSLPSASVLGLLRQRAQSRPAAPKFMALLADPVFEKDDPRFTPEMARIGSGPIPAEPRQRGFGTRGDFRRLRFARQEADQILAALSPEERAATLTAFDFDANAKLALSPELGQYRYLHFATHGVLDNEYPDLSGMALSLFGPDAREQDGYLRLLKIYDLKLAADLVTLSACETGLGKQVGGEGVIGLTRGFLHAGASRVLVSLWKVDDRASARLMGRVYEGIFREKLSPAAALRKAQRSFLADPTLKDPYLWAAFVLHGEPR